MNGNNYNYKLGQTGIFNDNHFFPLGVHQL